MRKFVIAVLLVAFAAATLFAQDSPKMDPGPSLNERLLSNDPAVALKARKDALAIGKPYLLELLKNATPAARVIAIELIAETGDASLAKDVAPLLDDFKAGRVSVASAAAKALGRLGYKDAVSKLVAGVKSPDIEFRYQCIKALGNLKAEEAETVLRDVLKEKADHKVETIDGRSQVCAAIEALGKIGSKKPFGLLKAIMAEISNKNDVETATERPMSFYAAAAAKTLCENIPDIKEPPKPETTDPAKPPVVSTDIFEKAPAVEFTGSFAAVNKAIEEWQNWWSRNSGKVDMKILVEDPPPAPPVVPVPESPTPPPPAPPEPPAPPAPPQDK